MLKVKGWALGALVVVAVAGGAWAFGLFGRGEKGEVWTVRRGPAVEVVYATGTVEPVAMAVIAPESAGRLEELLADDGKAVRAGEVLARLDDREERGAVDELTAKKRLNEISLKRAEALRAKSAGSQEALDQAQSQLKQAEAQLVQAEERLAKRALVSPLEGTVLRRDGEVGELIGTGQRVFVVGDLGQLRVELEVDEDDLPRIAAGQKVLLTADAFPDQKMEATLSEITPLGDITNKSYRVRATLPADTVLKVGMTVEANIVVKEVPDALLVPAGAVRSGQVQVKGFGGTSAKAVTVGIRGPEYVQITEGLEEGEKVLAPSLGKSAAAASSPTSDRLP